MKIFLISLLLCSTAFAGDYSYKVTEFNKNRNKDDSKIITASMTVEGSKDGKTVITSQELTKDEVLKYEADISYAKTIAERISSRVKAELDAILKETANVSKEADAKNELDAITIDSAKVK